MTIADPFFNHIEFSERHADANKVLSLGATKMPELPEVETVRRGLQPAMEGSKILKAEARRKDLRFPFQKDFVARLEGQTVTGLGRRAKYLMADLTSGDVLLMHLGMSGSFRVLQGRRQTRRRANSIFRAAKTAPMITSCSTCRRARRWCSTIRAASAT